jgi:D-beta-D-heptose 7-phosphate kinase/D-beta-D-heptose 1-phosphate adenosyltransferase
MKVFTNGCFDIIHRGHLELLKYCDSLACPAMGGHVVVGLNSDQSVGRLKGEDRPINSQEDRKFHLESLKFVYEVVIFEEETPYELIKRVNPDIIVKGGDYKKENVVGNDLCEVRIFNYMQGYSTTDLLSKF